MKLKVMDIVEAHPRISVAATAALVGFCLYNLVGSIELYHHAKMLAGELQRQASESLGG